MARISSQIVLSDYGEYLGTKNLKFAIFKNGKVRQKIDFHNVKEIYLKSGNSVSTQAIVFPLRQ